MVLVQVLVKQLSCDESLAGRQVGKGQATTTRVAVGFKPLQPPA